MFNFKDNIQLMKSILLLTDFSENSINAMRYALNLFENEFCTFHVLNVKNPSGYTAVDLISAGHETIYDTVIKKSRHKIYKLIVKLENEFENKNFSYDTLVSYNEFVDVINQIKKSKKIDLIVMGTNGVTGAKEIIFGSNTINVLRRVNCPTLVIPEGCTYKLPKEILLPLDTLDSLSGIAFKKLLTFAKNFSKTLHILRIKPNNEISIEEKNDKENINKFLNKLSSKYFNISNIPMHYAVSFYMQTHSIDLISLLVEKESFFERFFTGSSTTEISNSIYKPLLVFHN
jgi:nucleotide-binding universal stress UspA family protein